MQGREGGGCAEQCGGVHVVVIAHTWTSVSLPEPKADLSVVFLSQVGVYGTRPADALVLGY